MVVSDSFHWACVQWPVGGSWARACLCGCVWSRDLDFAQGKVLGLFICLAHVKCHLGNNNEKLVFGLQRLPIFSAGESRVLILPITGPS